MLRRDIADRLQSIVYDRFREEQPNRELTKKELENIWYTIYGKLCRGETEKEVEEYCKTVPLSTKKTQEPFSSLNDKISAAENKKSFDVNDKIKEMSEEKECI